jgi:hypothetical protein
MACLRLLGRGGGGAARLRLVEKWECGEPAAAGARAWSGAGAMPCCFGRPPPPPPPPMPCLMCVRVQRQHKTRWL